MEMAHAELARFQEILERKQAGQVQLLRRRDGIAIEKSSDQMDEIQFASERDLAIRNADRESSSCVRLERRYCGLAMAPLESAWIVSPPLAPSALQQCNGRHAASSVRRSPTANSRREPNLSAEMISSMRREYTQGRASPAKRFVSQD
jgi:hypothetical protein